MRRYAAIAVATILAACSSADPVTNTPPPPGTVPGSPATILLVTGDGQTAAPGTALPVKLAVQVKDAAGLVVPGVPVHFAIDSGGGSLSAPTGTTGNDGTVSGITWTLGVSGANVVAVTVNSLSPVRFHATATGVTARTILGNTAVGPAGGTFTYTKEGDALSGLSVTVMPGSFSVPSTWSIVADTSLTVPLPSDFKQVGPTLVINTGQGFADSNMTLTMPMQLGADMAVAPFYFDPASGTLEGIPLVARTETSATLATRHFSADLMAIPGSGAASALRSSLRQGFGSVRVVWVAIPQAKLIGTFTSGFLPGVDDWEFANEGDFLAPGGDCEGMSITAMYYHYLFRLGAAPGPGLYHKYDQSIANQWDNVQGIRYSGTVQADFADQWSPTASQIYKLWLAAQAQGAIARNLTATWVTLTLKLTGRPVLIALQRPGAGHAVVAYAVTSGALTTVVSVADPNQPGVPGVTLTYDQGAMRPTNFRTKAGYAAASYVDSYAMAVSAEISLTQLDSRWTEFTRGTAGSDRYAKKYRVEILNRFDQSWSPLTASVVSYSQQVNMRAICTDCPFDPADSVQHLAIWNGAGSDSILPPAFLLSPGPAAALNAVESAAQSPATDPGFLDVTPFSIVYHPVTIGSPTVWDPNVPLTFTVQNPPNVAGAHYRFEWDFGDGTALAVATDNPNANHTYLATGSRTVSVAITDLQTSHVIARAGMSRNVGPPAEFVQFTMSGSWPGFFASSNGFFNFTDTRSLRLNGVSAGLDAILFESDLGATTNGVTVTLMLPAGQQITTGQVFPKLPTASPAQAGRFQLTLSQDLTNVDNSPQLGMQATSGTLTINSVTTLPDGSFVAEYSFSLLNGTVGAIIGSGVGHWR